MLCHSPPLCIRCTFVVCQCQAQPVEHTVIVGCVDAVPRDAVVNTAGSESGGACAVSPTQIPAAPNCVCLSLPLP